MHNAFTPGLPLFHIERYHRNDITISRSHTIIPAHAHMHGWLQGAFMLLLPYYIFYTLCTGFQSTALCMDGMCIVASLMNQRYEAGID